jgi:hypothetical protein
MLQDGPAAVRVWSRGRPPGHQRCPSGDDSSGGGGSAILVP